jgi:hypothetical protein
MKLGYGLHGGPPPAANEHLTVDHDGSCTVWRSTGSHRVGAFAWTVPADELQTLHGLADAARAQAGQPTPGTLPDRPGTQVTIDDTAVATEQDAGVALRVALEGLLAAALDHPVAAVEIDADAGQGSAWLLRLGDGPLQALFDSWQATAEVLAADGLPRITAGLPAPPSTGIDDLPAGWRTDLTLPPALRPDPAEAETLVVQASFVLVHRGVPHTVAPRGRIATQAIP